jgi:tetratricopeptide (TPR) repeat protein
MAEITNVNLLWLRKARGVAPLSRYAVADDGTVTVSVPDELEVRTFHVARFDPNGRSQIAETYSVETLRRTEIATSALCYVGTTDDDLYLFREARKSRFLPDRRASYTDIALAPSGQRFCAAFCDLLVSGHALALGDISGRLLWTKDVAFPISRLAVDRDARHIAVAGETGDVLLLDAARTIVFEHRQEAPLLAVATAGPQRTVFAGGGGVGALDADGRLLWFTEVVGEPVEVALDAAGRTTAVLVRLDETSGRLVFLSPDGLPTWDVDFDEARPTGLSLSPSGERAAVTLRDGSIAVYALQYGERLASAGADEVLGEARAARDSGNLLGALDLLRARLDAVPSDVAACEALAETLQALRERALHAAATAEAVGDFARADAHLAELLAAAPLDADAVQRRGALRSRWAESARSAGAEALERGDGGAAEASFLTAIEADPLDAAAREQLAAARASASEGALRRGRELLAAGRFTEAIEAFTEAQTRGATGPDVSALLRQARAAEALALGNALYGDRQYAAALFQFKKVLRLDPGNAEAAQKIGYAQNFLQDRDLSERFTRLE